MNNGHTPVMSEEQFEELTAIIHDRSGILLPETKRGFTETRLAPRLEELGLDDFDHYIAFLSIGPHQADEFEDLLARLSITESCFFRNEPQLYVLEKGILPALIEARGPSKRLRIWSAACATGEEPYTLAIIAHRVLGEQLANWTVEIMGTDISERALASAREGVYHTESLRSTPEHLRTRYFTESSRGSWTIDPLIQSMVTFERHNLRESLAASRYGVWDVIFCRNTTMYFDDAMRRRVAETFAARLAPDGALFVGHTESLGGMSDLFEPLPHARGSCYRPLAPSASRVA